MVMQDGGSDEPGQVDPQKVDEWRGMLLKHTQRSTLGTVAVPDPETKNGYREMPMLTVVLEAERERLQNLREEFEEYKRRIEDCLPVGELERYKQWVADLQEGTFINCVYCGHRYPPGTPDVRSMILTEHIRQCPEHPLNEALELLGEAVPMARGFLERVGATMGHPGIKTVRKMVNFLKRLGRG